MRRPCYVVFAGVNGAGKSTFYHSGLWRHKSMARSMARINPDEIVREMGGDCRSGADQLKAAKEAYHRMQALLEQHRSFNQETTLTGRTSIRAIKDAHKRGYRVIMYYIGLNTPEKALERIAHRVETGGHPIAEETVRRRYRASLRNLSLAIDFCDDVLAFDNTTEFTCVAQWHRGVLSWIGNVRLCAPWLLDAVFDDDLWRKRY